MLSPAIKFGEVPTDDFDLGVEVDAGDAILRSMAL
jgi:hypothetical protein